MIKKHKDIILNVFIVTMIFILNLLLFSSYSFMYKFLSRYHNRLYYLLIRKYDGILFDLCIFCIELILFLPFYQGKIKDLLKYKKLNVNLIFRIISILILITTSIAFLLHIFEVLEMFRYFTNIILKNNNSSLHEIFKVKDYRYLKILPFNIIAAIILHPIIEEFIYRGVIYNRLKKISSVRIAIIISAIFFSFTHIPNYGFNIKIFTITIIGIFLAYSYEKTKNIWTSVFIHSIYNFWVLIMDIIYQSLHSYLHITINFLILIPGIIILIQENKKRRKADNPVIKKDTNL